MRLSHLKYSIQSSWCISFYISIKISLLIFPLHLCLFFLILQFIICCKLANLNWFITNLFCLYNKYLYHAILCLVIYHLEANLYQSSILSASHIKQKQQTVIHITSKYQHISNQSNNIFLLNFKYQILPGKLPFQFLFNFIFIFESSNKINF